MIAFLMIWSVLVLSLLTERMHITLENYQAMYAYVKEQAEFNRAQRIAEANWQPVPSTVCFYYHGQHVNLWRANYHVGNQHFSAVVAKPASGCCRYQQRYYLSQKIITVNSV